MRNYGVLCPNIRNRNIIKLILINKLEKVYQESPLKCNISCLLKESVESGRKYIYFASISNEYLSGRVKSGKE